MRFFSIFLLALGISAIALGQTSSNPLLLGNPPGGVGAACNSPSVAYLQPTGGGNTRFVNCSANVWAAVATSAATGTVTSFSAGNASPFFTSSVATATTTPALTFSISTTASGNLLANISGGAAAPSYNSLTSILDAIFSSTQGSILYRGASAWAALGPGTSGQFLKTQGAAANPLWASVSGTGCIPAGSANQVLVDSGAGGCTSTSVTIDTTAGRAGGVTLPQGTSSTPAANSILIQAPTSVTTAYTRTLAGAAATGIPHFANSSNVITETISSVSLTADVSGILPVANGGTNNAYFTVSGPASSAKTYTFPNANATMTYTVASGTKALSTSAISSATCTAAQTATATGTASTDVVDASFNGDPTAVTGFVPLTSGMLTIIAYPTTDTVNFKVCNNTGSSITPGAITLNWAVRR